MSMEKKHKIDIHIHVCQDKTKQGKMNVSNAEQMLTHLDELGIHRAIMMSCGERKGSADFTCNSECMEITGKYPDRYLWMCNIDPVDQNTVFDRLQRCKNQGARGIGEFMINRKMSDAFIQEVFRSAEILDMPILFHMSPMENFQYGIVDEPGLILLEESLKKYPELIFIGHSQPFWHEISGDAEATSECRMGGKKGKVVPGGRLIELMDHYSNLYADMSAYSGSIAMLRDEDFALKFIETFHHKLMYGTDMVNDQIVLPLGAWLDQMHEQHYISDNAYCDIFHRTAEKILKI